MQELLECDEIEPVNIGHDFVAAGEPVLSISNGTFVWDLEKTPEQLEEEQKKKAVEKKKAAAAKKNQEKADALKAKRGSVPYMGTEGKADAKTEGKELSNVTEEDDEKPYVWGGPVLKDINLSIKKGELVMVTGRVGSGKSSLLAALLGEINKLEGQVSRSGHVAYVPQSVWIRNASLKDNVTFSTPYDRVKFNATLKACALDTDIKILPAGADTEIGERGINLSGGQKARVQLARAVYCGADIYLLDDPLSAVDTHVARRLMDECLLGVLKDMTRVLVTHQIQFLTHADKIIVVDDGKIVAQGTLEDVQAHIDLKSLHHVTEEENEQNQADATAADEAPVPTAAKSDDDGKLVSEEEREKGAVGMEVYLMYFKAWGHWSQVIVLLLIFLIAQTCTEGTEVWLAWWTMDVSRSIQLAISCKKESLTNSSQVPVDVDINELVDSGMCNATSNGPPIKELLDQPTAFWNWIYVGIAIFSVVLSAGRGIYFQTRGVKASRKMVRSLVTSVLGGTMAFFDVTPSGRILNRFSADTDRLDTQLTNIFENYLGISAWITGALIVVCVLLPWFAIPFVPLCCFYKLTEMYFTPTARELQRLESVSRSPMVSHFTETVAGATTIRAFDMTKLFENRAIEYLDVNLRPVQLGQVYLVYSCTVSHRRWVP